MNGWNPMTFSDNAPQGFNDNVINGWATNAVADFSPDATNYFTFSQNDLTPSWSQMGNWGGPATTLGGRLQEGWNSFTNKAANAGSALANSGPVKSFMNMPGTDQLMAVAGAANAINNIWQGMNQSKMAKKQFNLAQQQWNTTWNAQKNLVNSEMSDRQRARVASNPNAYQSVDKYMSQYGVK